MSDEPFARARDDNRTMLTEAEAKTVLESSGIATPERHVVNSPEAAVDAAAALGYPVVVKVSTPAIPHKSEWRDGTGVAVDIESESDVLEAATAIFDGLAAADLRGSVLVESAVDTSNGMELILGGTRDPSFGPNVLLGIGGIAAEALDDVAHRLAPLGVQEADGMVDDLRAGSLLQGFRGRPAVDRTAVAEAVVAVGDLLVENDAIAEIDINPLLAGAEGVTALDAVILLDAD